MLIKTLVENTTASPSLGCEHGLSLWVQTACHTLLFDMGAGPLFAENAQKMGVDLQMVDTAVISHGHADHGGGLAEFLQKNQKATVYLQQHAFEGHFANRPNGECAYVGLNRDLLPNSRFVFTSGHFAIDKELSVFSKVPNRRLAPSGNQKLLAEQNGVKTPDDFSHEQNLVILENQNRVLIAGCAHNGIVNILDHFYTLYGCYPTHVLGGFHLYDRASQESESPARVSEIAQCLRQTGAQFYTCHCTGQTAYAQLKEELGGQMHYLATGAELTI
jgi:7,8-dihydropterin-6-yl-methyl-4-(beta-D-ribofuranosyl)aminobenzene 5'-phosphate synthase